MNDNQAQSKPDDSEQRGGKGLSVQRLVRRFNYHVRVDEGGWHQHICCDVEYHDGKVIRGRKQATLYTYDYEHKDECVDAASDLAAYFNANAEVLPPDGGATSKTERDF